MLRFTHNNQAIMDLTLTQIGLMIATAIILTAAVTFLANNDMQRKMELENVASQIVTLVQAMDAKSMENTTEYLLPDLGYDYTVTVSTEYVTVSAQGFYNNELSVKERFIIKPWVLDSSIEPPLDWVGGTSLHTFLENDPEYSHAATFEDPIQRRSTWDELLVMLDTQKIDNRGDKAANPIFLDHKKPVKIDKTILYFCQPEEYYQCKKGLNFDDHEGNIEIDGDDVKLYKWLIDWDRKTVRYFFQIPYLSEDIESLEIDIYYKATYRLLLDEDPGPFLSLKNWVESDKYYLNNGCTLGYSSEYKWHNESIDHEYIPQVIDTTEGLLIVELHTHDVTLLIETHTYINKVCVKAIPSVESYSDQQDYVFLYQD